MDSIEELAERQHGLIGREQALAHDMTRGQIDARLRSGRWERAARGVYRIPGSVPTWEQRLLTAVLATDVGAAASRRSAAALWSIPGFRPGPIEVTQARGPSRRNPARGVHDSRFLPTDRVRVVHGIPTTSPEGTLLDLGGCVHPQRAERALDNCLAMEATTIGQLGVMLAETGHTGVPARHCCAGCWPCEPPTTCHRPASWRRSSSPSSPPPVSSSRSARSGSAAPVRPSGGVDFVFRGPRVVVEADSRRYHSSWLDVQADHRRDLLLTAAGWRVLRVNWHQLVEDPDLFVQAVRATLARTAA